jgi:hypothetical protein
MRGGHDRTADFTECERPTALKHRLSELEAERWHLLENLMEQGRLNEQELEAEYKRRRPQLRPALLNQIRAVADALTHELV